MDQPNQLSKLSVALHWLLAIAMIGMLVFGLILEEMPNTEESYPLIALHKSIGVTIFVFALWRIINRIRNGLPSTLGHPPSWQRKVAHVVLIILISGTVLMPISGMLWSTGAGYGFAAWGIDIVPYSGVATPWMENLGHIIHGLFGKLLILVIALHLLASIKHHFIDKDGTLLRMLGKNIEK